jgi:hypothetical protein
VLRNSIAGPQRSASAPKSLAQQGFTCSGGLSGYRPTPTGNCPRLGRLTNSCRHICPLGAQGRATRSGWRPPPIGQGTVAIGGIRQPLRFGSPALAYDLAGWGRALAVATTKAAPRRGLLSWALCGPTTTRGMVAAKGRHYLIGGKRCGSGSPDVRSWQQLDFQPEPRSTYLSYDQGETLTQLYACSLVFCAQET